MNIFLPNERPTRLRAACAVALAVVLAGCALAQPGPQPPADEEAPAVAAARAGDARAQYLLGSELASAGDREGAGAWLCRAALQGHADAQLALADLYAVRRGDGLPDARTADDPMRAYLWYSVALLHGRDEAASYRDALAAGMDEAVVFTARQHAARWQQRRCAPV